MKNKFITKILIAVLAFPLLVIYFSCQSPAGPEDLTPGRRDYVWTVDTLNSPMNNLQSIWGSSPNDVWTVGPGGEDDSRLFHYDGASWKSWPIVCQGRTLYGFSKNDVWMGGGDGNIWHFDGTVWAQNYIYKPQNAYSVYITNIWGKNTDDVYAVGVIFYDPQDTQRGFILHYDGYVWKELFRANTYSSYQKIRQEENQVFIQGIKLSFTANDTTEFYQLNGNSLTTIYSKSNEFIYTGNINMIGGKVYFTIGRDIYRYTIGNVFEKRLSFSESEFGYQVYGKTENDLFVRMNNGLAHYNGTDLVYLQTFTNNFTSINNSPAIFENEVFFCVADYVNRINFVLRGKLN